MFLLKVSKVWGSSSWSDCCSDCITDENMRFISTKVCYCDFVVPQHIRPVNSQDQLEPAEKLLNLCFGSLWTFGSLCHPVTWNRDVSLRWVFHKEQGISLCSPWSSLCCHTSRVEEGYSCSARDSKQKFKPWGNESRRSILTRQWVSKCT